jgi:hypothetical protein
MHAHMILISLTHSLTLPYTNVRLHTHCVHPHFHTCIHTHACTYTRAYTHVHTHIYIIRTHVHTYTRTHVHTHTYVHIHVHTRTHTRTYTHVHTQRRVPTDGSSRPPQCVDRPQSEVDPSDRALRRFRDPQRELWQTVSVHVPPHRSPVPVLLSPMRVAMSHWCTWHTASPMSLHSPCVGVVVVCAQTHTQQGTVKGPYRCRGIHTNTEVDEGPKGTIVGRRAKSTQTDHTYGSGTERERNGESDME